MPQIPPTLSGLFGSIITLMIGSVAARASRTRPTFPVGKPGGVIPAPFVLLLIKRLYWVRSRFTMLLARARDASLRPVLPVAHRPKRERKPATPSVHLPWKFGWILEHGPNLVNYGKQLQYLCNLPEMKSLIAVEPGLGRMFRPLMNMLGAELPAHLKLPKRRRLYKPRPRKPREPRPRPQTWSLDYEKSKDGWTRAPETLPPWYFPNQPPKASPDPPVPRPAAAQPIFPPSEPQSYQSRLARLNFHGQR